MDGTAAADAAAAALDGAPASAPPLPSPSPSPSPPLSSAVAALVWLRGALGVVPTFVWLAAAGFSYMLFQLYANQNSLLYYPVIPNAPFKRPSDNPPPWNSPAGWGLRFEDVFLPTPDGETLHAWMCFAPEGVDSKAAPTIIFCHANAGNMGFRCGVQTRLHVGRNT